MQHKILWDFVIQTDHLIPARRPNLVIMNKKKKLPNGGFAILADYRVKIKENEKRNTYLDLAREQKMLWNMKVTVIPVIIGALRTIP